MQTFWGKHIALNPPEQTEVWELKFTKTKSIRFDAVQDHQRHALIEAKLSGLYHKLTDPPVFYNMQTRFNAKRPFDCMFITMAEAYVVVWFYKPRQPKVFIKIDIEEFFRMEHNADRKSFTEEMALEYGTPVPLVLK